MHALKRESSGCYPLSKECTELDVSAAVLQRGYRATYEQYGITERKELHHTLTAKTWSASALDAMLQAQQELLKSLEGVSGQPVQKVLAQGEAEKLGQPPVAKGGRAPEEFVSRISYEHWIEELAGALPLWQLEKNAPQDSLADNPAQLLRDLCTRETPVLRAVWAMKLALSLPTRPGGHEVRQSAAEAALLSSRWVRIFLEHCEGLLKEWVAEVQHQNQPGPLGGLNADPSLEAAAGFLLQSGGEAAWHIHYALCILGQTLREGMVDVNALCSWVNQTLRQNEAVTAVVMPLLNLLLPEAASSQALARGLTELCLLGLRREALRGGRGGQGLRFRRCYGEAVEKLLRLVPYVFVGMDIFAPPDEAGGNGLVRVEGKPSGSGSSAPSIILWEFTDPKANSLALTVLARRGSLTKTVQPAVLGCCESDLLKWLNSALEHLNARTVVQQLREKVKHRKQFDTDAEIVQLICKWACEEPAVEFALSSESILPNRRSDAAHALELKQAAALNLLRTLSGPEAGSASLQTAIVAWLNGQVPSSHTGSLDCQAVSLVTKMTEAGLFCPGVYLKMLIAHGLAPPPNDGGRRRTEIGIWHCQLLEQLDPRLRMPTLEDIPTPQTPGEEAAAASSQSYQERQYCSTREFVLQKWRREHDDGNLRPEKAAEQRKRRLQRSESREYSSYLLKRTRVGSTSGDTSREGSPFAPKPSRLGSLRPGAASAEFSRRTSSLAPSIDTSVTGLSASSDTSTDFRAVQRAAHLSLSEDSTQRAGIDADELLRAISSLREWEKRSLIDLIQNRMMRNPAVPEKLVAILPWAIAMVEACGGHAQAVGLLLELQEGLSGTKQMPLRSLVAAMLSARLRMLFLLNQLPRVLDACLSHHLKQSGKASKACHVLQQLACQILHNYRSDEQVSKWWSAAQSSYRALPLLQSLRQQLEAAGREDFLTFAPRLRISALKGLPSEQIPVDLGDAFAAALAGGSTTECHQAAKAMKRWRQAAAGAPGRLRASVDRLLRDAAQGEGPERQIAAICVLLDLRQLMDSADEAALLSESILASCAASSAEKASYLTAAIAYGLVDLGSACSAVFSSAQGDTRHHSGWVAALLGSADSVASSTADAVDRGVRAELSKHQLHVSTALVLEHVSHCVKASTAGDAADDAKTAVESILVNRALCSKLLSDRGEFLQSLVFAQEPHFAMAVAMALATGTLQVWLPDLRAPGVQQNLDVRLSQLLKETSPAAHNLLSLLLRCHLNEQIMVSAVCKGMPDSEAASRAIRAAQEAETGSTNITEDEKTFTSRVLAELLLRPEAAAELTALVWSVGRGLGEYLLQQAEWVLQDADTLLGHQTLRRVLKRRFGTLLAAVPGVDDADCPTGFALEQGFVDVVLACLAKSQSARHKEFAEQLVAQIKRLATLVRSKAADANNPAARTDVVAAEATAGKASEAAELAGAVAEPSVSVQLAAASGVGSPPSAFGAGRARRMSLQTAASVGSPVGIQLAVWLRLQLLPPLLPLIYAERAADAAKSLRMQLASALLSLLTSECLSTRLSTDEGDTMDDENQASAMVKALSAAEEQAGEPLFDRLLEILHGLLSGQWASWLRGDKTNLREVGPCDCRQLQLELSASNGVKDSVKAAVQSALNTVPATSRRGDFGGGGWDLPDFSARQWNMSCLLPTA